MDWVFKFFITNGTDRTLTPQDPSIPWGTWYRNAIDGLEPCEVEPGKTVEVLGIRAEPLSPTGYECSCTWVDIPPEGAKSYGSINLSIDVPFWSKNKSELTATGAFENHIFGWEDLPEDGHNFTRAITVTVGPYGFLKAEASVPAKNEDEELYMKALRQFYNNPDVRDWPAVESGLEELQVFRPGDFIPKELEWPLAPVLIGRTAPQDISEKLKHGVGDHDYNQYGQDLFVKKYFSIAVCSMAVNARDIITIPRRTRKKVIIRTKVTSVIKNVLETTFSIKTSLTAKAPIPDAGLEVAASLESQYGLKDIHEWTESKELEYSEETEYEAEDEDRTIVPYAFGKAVLIYRGITKDDKIALVAAQDFPEVLILKTYIT